MISTLLLCCAMLGEGAGATAVTPEDRAVYEAAQTATGRNAAAQVKLALWCESHGLSAERVKHLALAIASDPSNVLARGLAGLVSFQGKWSKPQDVGNEIKNDAAYQALIREYLDRRLRTPDKADPQWKLANWCAKRASRIKLWRTTATWCGSTRRGKRPGSIWDTRRSAATGSSPRSSRPGNWRPINSGALIRAGSPGLKSSAKVLKARIRRAV